MLKNMVKSVTLKGNSVVTVTDGESTREVMVKTFSCNIDSENSENPIEFTNFFSSEEAKLLYIDHKDEVRKDISDFEDAAFELRKAMIAEKQAETAE